MTFACTCYLPKLPCMPPAICLQQRDSASLWFPSCILFNFYCDCVVCTPLLDVSEIQLLCQQHASKLNQFKSFLLKLPTCTHLPVAFTIY